MENWSIKLVVKKLAEKNCEDKLWPQLLVREKVPLNYE